MVLDEKMIESTIEKNMEKTTSIKTELSNSSDTTDSVRPRDMVPNQSKEMLESSEKEEEQGEKDEDDEMEQEEEEEEPRETELDCSSCLLQEQMKEGNYELVSKVVKSWDLSLSLVSSDQF